MTKIYYIILTLVFSSSAFGQVGINTENPQQMFHIDGQKDNPATGIPNVTQQKNDFVVTSAGNVGVGVVVPTAKIHTVSEVPYDAFQMQDGSQAAGRFLSSDANGKGSWVNSPLTPIVFGLKNTSEITLIPNQNIGHSITLSKGKWMVYIGLLVNPTGNASPSNNTWMRITLSDSSSSQQDSGFDFLTSSLVSGWLNSISTTSTTRYTFLNGVIPVEITSNGSVTLYLRTREFSDVGTPPTVKTRGDYGENYLFAVPAY
ncbi:hypothetical protein DRF60_20580 [Chryseobacterium elymi]|uniref:Uncharacterized protein n=1 Tax=Chryseobacterium elymi TaxID=395936 RepID=A0A3D9D0L3_9FLAO|nr:hypothetical protein [Chryseobacterium elymi]REC71514.1 hypothetical protein DRF60_20580 [Chryseobacterium elymi]